MNLDIAAAIPNLAMFMPAFLFALCFHEYAHGWMAKRLGDNTAEMMGRLTMNPMAHADMLGTFILPAAAIVTGMPLFGWAKPVPVNPSNLTDKKNGMFWVAFAGPLSNILLAFVGAILLLVGMKFIADPSTLKTFFRFMDTFIFLNILLAVFNMLPFHPLDGGKVLERFIPSSWNRVLVDNQGVLQMVLLGFFIMGGFKYLATPIEMLKNVVMSSVGSLGLLLGL